MRFFCFCFCCCCFFEQMTLLNNPESRSCCGTRRLGIRDHGRDVLIVSSISDQGSEKGCTWFFEVPFKEKWVMSQVCLAIRMLKLRKEKKLAEILPTPISNMLATFYITVWIKYFFYWLAITWCYTQRLKDDWILQKLLLVASMISWVLMIFNL